MIKITSYKLFKLIHFYQNTTTKATTIGLFVIFRDEYSAKDEVLVNHEKIHIRQQLELLFVIQWILYLWFYISKRVTGNSHYISYRSNPFEREAYANQGNLKYLSNRKLFSWMAYIFIKA